VNESGATDIPARRRRLLVVVGLALSAGLAAAIAVALTSGGGDSAAVTTPCAASSFTGAPPLRIQLPDGDVKGTLAQLKAAQRELPAGDVRIAVARAISRYSSSGAAATVAALRTLPQAEPVVGLHLGLAEIWAGRCDAGFADLRRTRTLDPYGFYGTLADDALHTEQRPGYPLYIAPPGVPSGDVKQLRRLAARQPNRSDVWLALAYQLQQTDHVEALADARKALELDPTGVSPRVAVAVLAYSKDDPSATFAVLGPLTQQASDTVEIRFHLGELLYKLKQDTDAAAQWRQVEQDSPNSIYGLVSAQLMSRIAASS
jgi:tetratricopeptide (TPR) repeat protein